MLKRPRHPYSIATLAAALTILVLGIAFKPAKKSARPLSESDLSRVPQASATMRWNDLSRYLTDASANAAPRLAYLQSVPHTAVLWDGRRALTPAAADGVANGNAEWKRIPAPSGAPFAIWSIPGAPEAAPEVAPSIATGDWVLAVARSSSEQTVFGEGNYQGMTDAHCGRFAYRQVNSSANVSANLMGGGLFTADGKLLGMIAACDGDPVVISVESIAAALRQPVFITDRLQEDFGLRFQESAAGLQAVTVWAGSASAKEGWKVGDIVVQADGHAVAQWSDLEMLVDGNEHSMAVRRGSRTVHLTLGRKTPQSEAAGMKLALSPGGSQVAVSAVAPNSPASRADIQAGDILLAVGGVTVNAPGTAQQAILRRSTGKVVLRVARGRATAEVLLVP